MSDMEFGIENNLNSDDPHSAWLPITASRNGNACYSAFHAINSGIGYQVLMLPVALSVLGWVPGIVCLILLFLWQFYTMGLLINLHESVPAERYDRYLKLSIAAFGERLGKLLALFPVMYLSGASCTMLMMAAADSMKLFRAVENAPPLSTIECYIIFVFVAVVLALMRPNLNSVAWISFIGATAAVSYCTIIWAVSISKTRQSSVSHHRVTPHSNADSVLSVFNALGIIALAFRGHNLILEIQATIPSTEEKPSRQSMWRGMNYAEIVIFFCFLPLTIGGYWAYGDKIATQGTVLNALHIVHGHDTSRFVQKLIAVLVFIHCLCSFQIYAMPTVDNMTFKYISRKKRPCPKWIQSAFRVVLGCVAFFIAVAIPFLRSIAGLLGGITLPLTFSYPCFMWIAISKPKRWSVVWCTNFLLGSFGIILGVFVFAGGVWTLIWPGIDVRFFKP